MFNGRFTSVLSSNIALSERNNVHRIIYIEKRISERNDVSLIIFIITDDRENLRTP